MAKVKPKETPKEKVVPERVQKRIWILSKENVDLTLDHGLVCRVEQRCHCSIRVINMKRVVIPSSVHVIAGIPTEVPEVLLREKGGRLPAMLKSGVCRQLNDKEAKVLLKRYRK